MTGFVRWAGRRVRDRLGLQRAAGTADLSVAELVSPFRYDIVVRQELFAWLDAHPDQADDPDARRAGSASYRTWFELFGVQDGAWWRQQRFGTFEAQVGRAVDVWRRFDPDRPDFDGVLVRRVADGQRTTNGKLLAARHLPVDGFHRLALCRLRGIDTVPAGRYEVLETARTPVDNTERLLAALRPGLASYLGFLASGYGVAVPATVEELLAAVAERRPDRLAELRSVLTVDLPALGLDAPEEAP